MQLRRKALTLVVLILFADSRSQCYFFIYFLVWCPMASTSFPLQIWLHIGRKWSRGIVRNQPTGNSKRFFLFSHTFPFEWPDKNSYLLSECLPRHKHCLTSINKHKVFSIKFLRKLKTFLDASKTVLTSNVLQHGERKTPCLTSKFHRLDPCLINNVWSFDRGLSLYIPLPLLIQFFDVSRWVFWLGYRLAVQVPNFCMHKFNSCNYDSCRESSLDTQAGIQNFQISAFATTANFLG